MSRAFRNLSSEWEKQVSADGFRSRSRMQDRAQVLSHCILLLAVMAVLTFLQYAFQRMNVKTLLKGFVKSALIEKKKLNKENE